MCSLLSKLPKTILDPDGFGVFEAPDCSLEAGLDRLLLLIPGILGNFVLKCLISRDFVG